jgi:prephenate dehydrogenase
VTPAPRTGVLGLGLVGGSVLQGLGAAGADMAGWDADAAAAGAAARAGFPVLDGARELARACELVIVCVPPHATAAAVAELLEADPGVVVADAASVKAPVLAEVAARVGEAQLRRYVPAHPLAGSEKAGWAGADPALLRDAVWAVCPSSATAPCEALCALSAALEPLGARLLACDAGAHDAAVARTSHAPHVVAAVVARASEAGLLAALTGGAYRDMTRTVAADPGLWTSILLANRVPVAVALRDLAAGLGELADAVEAGDADPLDAAWRAGAAARARADAVRWSEPAWTEQVLPWPAWDALLDHGLAGRTVRRLRRDGDALRFELADG